MIRNTIVAYSKQMAMTAWFCVLIVYSAHNSTIVEHQEQFQRNNTMRQDVFGLQRAHDIQQAEACYHICVKKRIRCKSKIVSELLPAFGTFPFIAVNIFALPPKTVENYQYVVIIKNWITKLARKILTPKVAATHIENSIVDD